MDGLGLEFEILWAAEATYCVCTGLHVAALLCRVSNRVLPATWYVR